MTRAQATQFEQQKNETRKGWTGSELPLFCRAKGVARSIFRISVHGSFMQSWLLTVQDNETATSFFPILDQQYTEKLSFMLPNFTRVINDALLAITTHPWFLQVETTLFKSTKILKRKPRCPNIYLVWVTWMWLIHLILHSRCSTQLLLESTGSHF